MRPGKQSRLCRNSSEAFNFEWNVWEVAGESIYH